MPCCKCCCEGGSPGGVCCGENCCVRPGVCCGGTCCPEGEFCCGEGCCPDGNNCCDGVCQSEPCDPPCDPPCDNCSDCIDGECVSRCAEGENCCDGNCLECCDDPDCPEGQVCVNGECVETPCDDASLLCAVDGEYLIAKNPRTDCTGGTYQDTDFPCNRCISGNSADCGFGGQANAFPPGYGPCAGIEGVPAEYDSCTCAFLEHRCVATVLTEGVDDANVGCLATDSKFVTYQSVFYFDATACQWVRANTTKIASVPGGCIKLTCDPRVGITGECNAPCPEVPDCDIPCDGPFEGCDCNPLP